MPSTREFKWTRESKRKDAERTTAAALDIMDKERSRSADKVARLKAMRLARDGAAQEPASSRSAQR